MQITDSNHYPIRIVYHDGQKKVIASYASNDEQSHYLKIGTVSTSSNTITWANRTQWASANGNKWGAPVVAYGDSQGTLLHNLSWTNAGDIGKTRQFKYTSQATNATTHNIIGFAPSAISDGATGVINLHGNTIDNQSGLTAGTKYYVQNDGTIGTSYPSRAAGGVGLSSSKLLITM